MRNRDREVKTFDCYIFSIFWPIQRGTKGLTCFIKRVTKRLCSGKLTGPKWQCGCTCITIAIINCIYCRIVSRPLHPLCRAYILTQHTHTSIEGDMETCPQENRPSKQLQRHQLLFFQTRNLSWRMPAETLSRVAIWSLHTSRPRQPAQFCHNSSQFQNSLRSRRNL